MIIRPEPSRLSKPAWEPDKGGFPLDLDGAQHYARLQFTQSPFPYPDMIGGITATNPLYDVYSFSPYTRPGNTFYNGGQKSNEVGGPGAGIGGNSATLMKLLG